ncbi:MAG: dienelactone hydrolase family protein [Chitinophagaceae bacterium]|nr:dienelactone hydrolase family protein [Chitinophagaceae bacterium]
MDQQIINLFDEYTHKPLKREDFIKKLILLTGSITAAMTALSQLEVKYDAATTIAESSTDIVIEKIEYPTDDITMKGYLARPSAAGKYGAVVVIHENRGLNPHIEDVTRRVANAGFIALAPDALSETGGTPTDADQARDLIGKLDMPKNIRHFVKAFDYLQSRPECNGNLGCVGFCWGGAMANQLAVHVPSLKAAVAFYGRQPEAADVAKIKAALQLHYAGMDERVNAGIPAYEEALKKAGITYELYMYEGAQHAFHNDTAGPRYDAAAAKLAWQRTIQFFNNKLK